jgi:hypothetical protein
MTSPMKTILLRSIYDELNSDAAMFCSRSDFGSDLEHYLVRLRDIAKARGFEVTADQTRLDSADAVVFLDHPSDRRVVTSVKRRGARTFLIHRECVVIRPINWSREVVGAYDHIFTFNPKYLSTIIGAEEFTKVFFARNLTLHHNFWNNNRSTQLCLIASNKVLVHPKSTYEYRSNLVKYFDPRNEIEVYGPGWNTRLIHLRKPFSVINRIASALHLNRRHLESYRGISDDKLLTFSKYNFALCIENTKDFSGYITEKIFDALRAGTIPVYLGPSDIDEFVPSDIFVDLRQYSNLADLSAYVKSRTSDELADTRARIANFLQGPSQNIFGPEAFAHTFLQEVGRHV